MGSDELYLSHLGLIERAIGAVCRRHCLFGADSEDFASTVRLHLIEDDYAVLRAYQGRSSLHTYLLAVITYRFQDWRNARWGKWRPSAEAKRLGPLAVRLEQLTVRDGLSLDEAHETLRAHFNVTDSRQTLEALAVRFPDRSGRTFVSDEALEDYPAVDTRADAPLREREAAAIAHRAVAALASVIAKLPAQDRLILKMQFERDLSVANIARSLHLDQKKLYRRIQNLLADLRAALEALGLSAAAVGETLGDGGFDVLNAGEGSGERPGEVRPFERGGRSPAGNVRAE